MGMALTAPISSAAIGIMLGLDGLAAGAALAGCCAQMVGLAIMSMDDNCLLYTSHFQLSKAAIQTGVHILLENSKVDTIYIAGGFGSHLDVNDLKVIQVIPEDIKYAHNIGNSAIKGCYKLLMSQDFERVNAIVDKAKSINLANYEDFEDILVESLYFYD